MASWRLGYQDSHRSVTSLIEQDPSRVSLANVLDDPDIMSEIASGNIVLFHFLARPDILRQLFRYLFDPKLDESLRYKYPFLCAEILVCETHAAMQASGPLFVAMQQAWADLMPQAWAFLDQPAPIAHNIISNYARALVTIMHRLPNLILQSVKATPDIVAKFERHLYSHVTAELLYKLWTLDDAPGDGHIVRWWNQQGWTRHLLERLAPDRDPEDHLQISQILVNMIALVNDERVPNNDLIQDMAAPEAVALYWRYLADRAAPHYASSLTAVLDICMELIRRSVVTKELFPNKYFAIDALLHSFAEQFDLLDAVLREPAFCSRSLRLSNGPMMPLGVERLKVCEFFAELIQVDHPPLLQAFLEHDINEKLLNLFFMYQWNNFLHAAVVDYVANLFAKAVQTTRSDAFGPITVATPLSSVPDGHDKVVFALFNRARLTSRLLAAQKQNDASVERPRGYRLGYMGHLHLLTEEVIKLAHGIGVRGRGDSIDGSRTRASRYAFLSVYLDEDPEWLEYEKIFQMTTTRYQTILGGGPRPIPGPDSTSETDELGTGLEADFAQLGLGASGGVPPGPLSGASGAWARGSGGLMYGRRTDSSDEDDDLREGDDDGDDGHSDELGSDEGASDDAASDDGELRLRSRLRYKRRSDEEDDDEEGEGSAGDDDDGLGDGSSGSDDDRRGGRMRRQVARSGPPSARGSGRSKHSSRKSKGSSPLLDRGGPPRSAGGASTSAAPTRPRHKTSAPSVDMPIDTDFSSNGSLELQHYSDQLARFFCQQIANQVPEHFLSDDEGDDEPEDGSGGEEALDVPAGARSSGRSASPSTAPEQDLLLYKKYVMAAAARSQAAERDGRPPGTGSHGTALDEPPRGAHTLRRSIGGEMLAPVPESSSLSPTPPVPSKGAGSPTLPLRSPLRRLNSLSMSAEDMLHEGGESSGGGGQHDAIEDSLAGGPLSGPSRGQRIHIRDANDPRADDEDVLVVFEPEGLLPSTSPTSTSEGDDEDEGEDADDGDTGLGDDSLGEDSLGEDSPRPGVEDLQFRPPRP